MQRIFEYHHSGPKPEENQVGYRHATYPNINNAMLTILLKMMHDIKQGPVHTPTLAKGSPAIYDQQGERHGIFYLDNANRLRLLVDGTNKNAVYDFICSLPNNMIGYHIRKGGSIVLAHPLEAGQYEMSPFMLEMIRMAAIHNRASVDIPQQKGYVVEQRGYLTPMPDQPDTPTPYVQLFNYFASFENARATFEYWQQSPQGSPTSKHLQVIESRVLQIPDYKLTMTSPGFGTLQPAAFLDKPPADHFGFLLHPDPDGYSYFAQQLKYAVEVEGHLLPDITNSPQQPATQLWATLHTESETHALDTLLRFNPATLYPPLANQTIDNDTTPYRCNRVEFYSAEKGALAEIALGPQMGHHADPFLELNNLSTQHTYLAIDPVYRSNLLPEHYRQLFNGHQPLVLAHQLNRDLVFDQDLLYKTALLSSLRPTEKAFVPYTPYIVKVVFAPHKPDDTNLEPVVDVRFPASSLQQAIDMMEYIPFAIPHEFVPGRYPPQPVAVTIIDANGHKPFVHLDIPGRGLRTLIIAPDYLPAQTTDYFRSKYPNICIKGYHQGVEALISTGSQHIITTAAQQARELSLQNKGRRL